MLIFQLREHLWARSSGWETMIYTFGLEKYYEVTTKY